MSVSCLRNTPRASFRLCPVLRMISLTDTSSPTCRGKTAFAPSRCDHPAFCKRSATVRTAGFTVTVSTAMPSSRINFFAHGAKVGIWHNLCGASAYPPPRSLATISIWGATMPWRSPVRHRHANIGHCSLSRDQHPEYAVIRCDDQLRRNREGTVLPGPERIVCPCGLITGSLRAPS